MEIGIAERQTQKAGGRIVKDHAILKRISELLDDDVEKLNSLGREDIVCALQIIQIAILCVAKELLEEATNKQDHESN